MPKNLLKKTWLRNGWQEVRILLDEYIGGGQQDGNRLHLPEAGGQCKVILTFRKNALEEITAGQGHRPNEWKEVVARIEKSLNGGSVRIGRDYSFSRFRVDGSWRGKKSCVQILPPLDEAPRAPVPVADHPFILEFPIQDSDVWRLTNLRRTREHGALTRLLNVLLEGRMGFLPTRTLHFWALVSHHDGTSTTEWVKNIFPQNVGQPVIDSLSTPVGDALQELPPEDYRRQMQMDETGLRVPTDLDDLIRQYKDLPLSLRDKFDRAAFWIDLAGKQWEMSMSASFASYAISS